MRWRELDWLLVFTWLGLTIIGLIAIYSATLGPVSEFLPDNILINFWKQSIFVIVSTFLLFGVQFTAPRTFQQGSYFFYGIVLIVTIVTLFFGTEVNGAKSWLRIAGINIQISELMKIATVLAVAHYLTSRRNISAERLQDALIAVALILVPGMLVILQNDLGTALVILSLIPIMLFWSGLPYGISLLIISPAIIVYFTVLNTLWGVFSAVLIVGLVFFIQRRPWITISSIFLGFVSVFGVNTAFDKLLKPYQVSRIMSFVNPSFDPQGGGWNVIQAKTAIGSGGVFGKGFLQGTQTQLRFLPEQWTDFIFCVIGEEFGLIGTGLTLVLFMFLLLRLLNIAGTHKHPFAQLVIVGFTGIYFVHMFINIASASGLLPVIGLPLPFVSYGGSAFLSNTLMLSICLNFALYHREFSIYA